MMTQSTTVHVQAKPKTERKLSFAHFLIAIHMLAAARHPGLEQEVSLRIITQKCDAAAANLYKGAAQSDGICE